MWDCFLPKRKYGTFANHLVVYRVLVFNRWCTVTFFWRCKRAPIFTYNVAWCLPTKFKTMLCTDSTLRRAQASKHYIFCLSLSREMATKHARLIVFPWKQYHFFWQKSGSHARDELLTLYVKANIDRSTTQKRFSENISSSPQPFQALNLKRRPNKSCSASKRNFFKFPALPSTQSKGTSKTKKFQPAKIIVSSPRPFQAPNLKEHPNYLTSSDPHHGISKHSVP